MNKYRFYWGRRSDEQFILHINEPRAHVIEELLKEYLKETNASNDYEFITFLKEQGLEVVHDDEVGFTDEFEF